MDHQRALRHHLATAADVEGDLQDVGAKGFETRAGSGIAASRRAARSRPRRLPSHGPYRLYSLIAMVLPGSGG